MPRIVVFSMILALAGAPLAHAQGTPSTTAKPSAPPLLARKVEGGRFHCQRNFLYQGRAYPCDSHLRWDGENLRPIIKDVPQAVSELNEYQSTRRSVQNLAYVGTIGLFVAAIGHFVVAKRLEGTQAVGVRNAMVLGGIGLTAGSTLYGLALLRANERHLNNAVRYYNEARPDQPIELQFTAEVSF